MEICAEMYPDWNAVTNEVKKEKDLKVCKSNVFYFLIVTGDIITAPKI